MNEDYPGYGGQQDSKLSSTSMQDPGIKLRRKEPRIPKCCVVGDGGAGKTSMMMMYTLGKILTEYEPTCFENYTSKSSILSVY
jgi:GTPase SAR1 family protein